MGFGPKSEEAKTQGKKTGKNHFMRAALKISFIRRISDNCKSFLTRTPRISYNGINLLALYLIHEYRSRIVTRYLFRYSL